MHPARSAGGRARVEARVHGCIDVGLCLAPVRPLDLAELFGSRHLGTRVPYGYDWRYEVVYYLVRGITNKRLKPRKRHQYRMVSTL